MITAQVDPARIVEWMRLDDLVTEAGGTLREAVHTYIEILKQSKNSIPVSKAIQEYVKEKVTELSPYTLSDRRRRLKAFSNDNPESLVSDINPKPFLDKLALRTSHVNADNSRRSLSAFYTWCVNKGYVEISPFKKIGSYVSKKGGAATVLSPDQASGLMEAVESNFDPQVA